MRNPTLKEFNLTKATILKNKGMHLEYNYQFSIANEAHNFGDKPDITVIPHQDLTVILDSMKPFALQICKLDLMRKIVASEDFKATDEQLEIIEKALIVLTDDLQIMGITLSGQDQNRGAQIICKLKVNQNQFVSMTTQRIRFNSKHYGFEDTLEQMCTEFVEEVYKYRYEGKKGMLDIFEPDKTEPENDLFTDPETDQDSKETPVEEKEESKGNKPKKKK